MYRRTIATIAIVLMLAGAGIALATDSSTPSAQSQASTSATQDSQACSWPSGSTTDRGECNQCAVACGGGQSAVCSPGIVESGTSACLKQPECTCR